MNHWYEKDISGCGLIGIINRDGSRVSGEVIRRAICLMRERGNGLGAGFAAYGIYPEHRDSYAFHLMYQNERGKELTEEHFRRYYIIDGAQPIPTRTTSRLWQAPALYRYFVRPKENALWEEEEPSGDDRVVKTVMTINSEMDGAYVFSSGKNMGVFKGVGEPAAIAAFYDIDHYEGYAWTAHTRFPTNTPGWWGGAHPFTILDWSIVHNGEISSYGINKRYLEGYGYRMTLFTDTEVVAYMLDLLIRRHGLHLDVACKVLASPFWRQIARKSKQEEVEAYTALRHVYGSALLNGPFSIIFGFRHGLCGLNDRIKLRPLVAAARGDSVYMASEESAIREICPAPDRVWSPRAGEPVVAELKQEVKV